MRMLREIQCVQCKHFKSDCTCDAFPTKSPDDDGLPRAIPKDIVYGRHDHRYPYPGDHGIQFELKDPD